MPHEWMSAEECIERLQGLRESCEEAAADGDPRWRFGLIENPLVGTANRIDQDGSISQALDVVALSRAIEAVEHANKSICSYCGHVSEKSDRDAQIDHVLVCEKRPEKKLLDTLMAVRAILERLAEAPDSVSDDDFQRLEQLLSGHADAA